MVEKLPLMASPVPLIIICVVYYRIIRYEGLEFMKNRNPWNMLFFVRFYNAFQVVACSFFIWKFYQLGFSLKSAFTSCNNFDSRFYQEVVNTFWWFMLLRLSEFVETIMFVLRKKNNQISTLHIFHHVAVVSISYLFFKYAFHMVIFTGVMVNSMVHVIMYSYYFFSTFNILRPFLNKIKHYLTSIQILQLIVLLIQGICFYPDQCGISFIYYLIVNTFLIILLSLFVFFYLSNFVGTSKNKSKKIWVWKIKWNSSDLL